MAALSSGGTTMAPPAASRISAASPRRLATMGRSQAMISNILEGMKVAKSGTSRSGTRAASAAAQIAGIRSLGCPSRNVTFFSCSAAASARSCAFSAPSPTMSRWKSGSPCSNCAAASRRLRAWEMPRAPA